MFTRGPVDAARWLVKERKMHYNARNIYLNKQFYMFEGIRARRNVGEIWDNEAGYSSMVTLCTQSQKAKKGMSRADSSVGISNDSCGTQYTDKDELFLLCFYRPCPRRQIAILTTAWNKSFVFLATFRISNLLGTLLCCLSSGPHPHQSPEYQSLPISSLRGSLRGLRDFCCAILAKSHWKTQPVMWQIGPVDLIKKGLHRHSAASFNNFVDTSVSNNIVRITLIHSPDVFDSQKSFRK